MFEFNKLLYKNNKIKYIFILVSQIIISWANVILTKSFYKEEAQIGLLILILQGINIYYFILLRLTYNKEMFLLQEDGIHLFLMNSDSKIRALINKIRQLLIFTLWQFITLVLFILLLELPINNASVLLFNFIISVMILFFLYFYSVTIKNSFRKNLLDGIVIKLFACSVMWVLYNPFKYYSYILLAAAMFIEIISDIYLIKKGIKVDDKSREFKF